MQSHGDPSRRLFLSRSVYLDHQRSRYGARSTSYGPWQSLFIKLNEFRRRTKKKKLFVDRLAAFVAWSAAFTADATAGQWKCEIQGNPLIWFWLPVIFCVDTRVALVNIDWNWVRTPFRSHSNNDRSTFHHCDLCVWIPSGRFNSISMKSAIVSVLFVEWVFFSSSQLCVCVCLQKHQAPHTQTHRTHSIHLTEAPAPWMLRAKCWTSSNELHNNNNNNKII